MVRKYRLKNPHNKGAKKPPEIYQAITLQYCKGRSQAGTARVVSRWAKMKGLPTVSRQTVINHYAKLGDKLFHLSYLNHYGPCEELICDECRNDRMKFYRDYLYADNGAFAEERDQRQERQWWTDLTPLMNVYFKTVVFSELWETSKNGRGLPENTFYIYWSRVYWLREFQKEFPGASYKELVGALVSKCSEELSLQKGNKCHQVADSQSVSRSYHTNGVLYVRISYTNLEDDDTICPHMAEVCGRKTKLQINNSFIEKILNDYAGDWCEITLGEFENALKLLQPGDS